VQQLEGLKDRFPDVIVEVRGKGLLLGVKLIPNNREFMGWARDHAQLLVAGGGDNLVRILPPLNLSIEDAQEAIRRFETTCEHARKQIKAAG
jgi:acetylornithine/N-succinyldiaminopimelate aminotransferase